MAESKRFSSLLSIAWSKVSRYWGLPVRPMPRAKYSWTRLSSCWTRAFSKAVIISAANRSSSRILAGSAKNLDNSKADTQRLVEPPIRMSSR